MGDLLGVRAEVEQVDEGLCEVFWLTGRHFQFGGVPARRVLVVERNGLTLLSRKGDQLWLNATR